MNKHWIKFCYAGAVLCMLTSCMGKKVTLGEYTFEAQPVDLKIDSVADGYRVEGLSAFRCILYGGHRLRKQKTESII